MPPDPYDRPTTAHGRRGGASVQQKGGYYDDYNDDDVDIDYPNYGNEYGEEADFNYARDNRYSRNQAGY